MMLPHLSALLIGAQMVVTVADEIPKLDVAPSCRAAASVPPASMERCLKEEQDARDILARTWTQFASGDRGYCAPLNSIGGISSYVELLTCLEIARDARKLPEDKKN